MARRRSENLQQKKIRRAGRELFTRLGYQRTTISGIAKAAGISKATIYLHFPSKEALFSSIVHDDAAEIRDDARRQVDQVSGYCAKVETFFTARLNRLGELEGIDQLSRDVFLEMVQRADAILQHVFEQECQELTKLLQQGHAAGELMVLQPGEVARAMVGALRAINLEAVYRCTSGDAQRQVQQIMADVKALLAVILRGLTPLERLGRTEVISTRE